MLFVSSGAAAQAQAPEPDLKAAIITNMLFFVEWPARNASLPEQLTICIQGSSPVATALAQLDGKTIRGKNIRVLQAGSANVTECQAIYLSSLSTPTIDKTLVTLGSLPVLIASDTPEFLQRGSMLNLELVSGRIVFDINLRSAQKAGLQISSKALRMARQVIE